MTDTSRAGTVPFGPGSIALKLYGHDQPADEIAGAIRIEARAAESAGFDGVVVSEHHREVLPGYLPNPLLAVNWSLAATERIWAAPAPLLLLLRPAVLLLEDVAWSAAAFPGRLGLGVAAGGVETDFALIGSDHHDLTSRFASALDDLSRALRGDPGAGWDADRAVARLATAPVPLVSAAASSAACRRAAQLGCGVLLDSQITLQAAARYLAAYLDAGGTGPRVLVRRVWVGSPPTDLLRAQVAGYRNMAPDYNRDAWADPAAMIISGTGGEIADRLADSAAEVGADAFNLRVHIPGIAPADSLGQILRVGSEVLPKLRRRFPPGLSPPSVS